MSGDPNGFSDEELLALIRDPSVGAEAIISEMQDAGAEPLSAAALGQAREALADLTGAKAYLVANLPPGLRALVLEEALAQKAVGLATALSGSPDKAVAKEGKRLVHLLRTQGVKLEPKPKPAAPSSSPGPEELPTFMSTVTGFGERILLLGKPARQGVDFAQVVVSDVTGVVDARLAELARKEYRRFVQNLSGANGVLVGEVPRAYARGLVTKALDQNARVRRPVPTAFNDVAFILGPSMPPSPSPGRALPLSDDAASFSRRAAELLGLAELRSWLPEEATLRPFALKLEEIGVSPLFLDDAQREQAVRDTLDAAVRAYWTPERRHLVAERLFDVGYLLHGAGREEDAQLALASAHEIESDRNLEGVAFCFALFEKLLPILRARSEKPAEHTSPGGVILP